MTCNQYPINRDIDTLMPSFRTKVEKFLAANPNIFITETHRSNERQQCLIHSGASRIARSRHQDGLAIDIAFRGKELYPPLKVYDSTQGKSILNPVWRTLGDSAKSFGLDWGYDLWAHTGFIDATHFEDDGSIVLDNNSSKDTKQTSIQPVTTNNTPSFIIKLQHLQKLLNNTTAAYKRVLEDIIAETKAHQE